MSQYGLEIEILTKFTDRSQSHSHTSFEKNTTNVCVIIFNLRYPKNGTSDFCKAEIAPLPYNSEFTINSEHGRHKVAPTNIWASPTSAKSLRSLRIYVLLWARKAVQILYSDITFIWYLTSICFWYYNLHLVGLRRMRLCLKLRQGFALYPQAL